MPAKTNPTETVWLADVEELYSVEQEVMFRELGIQLDDAEEMQARMPSVMALAAVLIARRSDKSIPLDRYKTLRQKDLTLPKHDDDQEHDDQEDADPT